ncbi:hypothetical protein [Salinigranum salinum]|uniref:hypothetical protein n=1 Tax=Salinigranum salinum TaxID=1364937 RepID=UPI00126052F9|nr:hypothetical protein [Salinigranum salinum]
MTIAIRRWLRMPEFWVGGASILDLLTGSWGDFLVPLISLWGGVVGSQIVTAATTWLVFAVVFYTFAPLAYGSGAVLAKIDREFKTIFAGGAVVHGVVFEYIVRDSIGVGVVVLIVAYLTTSWLLVWYLSFVRGWTVLNPRGRLPELVDRILPAQDVIGEIEAELERDGLCGLLAAALFLTVGGMLLALPVALSGLLSSILISAYPFPDLVFFGWALASAVFSRLSIGPSEDRIRALRFDIEKFLVGTLENALRSFEGLLLISLGFMGILFSGTLLTLLPALWLNVIEAVPSLPATLLQHDIEALLAFWYLLGIAVMVPVMGLLAFWAWIREFRRLPYFLDEREERDTTDGEPPSRVPGVTIFPSVGVLAVLGTGVLVSTPEYRLLGLVAFALLWPLVVGLGWVIARRTRRVDDQSVTHEHYWIVGSFVFQFVVIPAAAQVARMRSQSVNSANEWLDLLAAPLGLLVLLALMSGFVVLNRYETRDGTADNWTTWYIILAGSICLLSFPIIPARYRFAFAILGILGFGGGGLMLFVRRLREGAV